MTSWPLLVELFISVFALVDPIGALPFYVALTEGFSVADRRIVVRRSVTVLGGVLGLFALLGRFVFSAFGITLPDFEIAGGILLFLVAYDMLHGEVTRTKLSEADREAALARRDEIAVVPLGIPLLAGPGAISTVMIYEGNAGADPVGILAVFAAVGLTTALTYVILEYGQGIFRRVGPVGITALTRVLGLLLAALAVQFVVRGITGAFPGL